MYKYVEGYHNGTYLAVEEGDQGNRSCGGRDVPNGAGSVSISPFPGRFGAVPKARARGRGVTRAMNTSDTIDTAPAADRRVS